MTTIRITLNGTEHIVNRPITLAQLLAKVQAPAAAQVQVPLASAVNGRHVSRQARDSYELNDQDVVTTFEPITGG